MSIGERVVIEETITLLNKKVCKAGTEGRIVDIVMWLGGTFVYVKCKGAKEPYIFTAREVTTVAGLEKNPAELLNPIR